MSDEIYKTAFAAAVKASELVLQYWPNPLNPHFDKNKLMQNIWDILSPFFNTTKDETEISPRVADNILIAWPVILDFIKENKPHRENLRLLEYGCGTGSFAYKLYKLGYDVTGVDSSEGMIVIANQAYGDEVKFLVGDSLILSEQTPFSIITSVMTFQFVEDIEKTFRNIHNVLEPGGIFVFAVFNPTFIKECLRTKTFFEDFDSFERPKIGKFNLNGNKIPVFIRTAQEYNEMLSKLGFEPLLEKYPPFTEEFLRKYPISTLVNESEYLILGYKKS